MRIQIRKPSAYFQISTLRFALRMMCVPVEAAVNEHYDPWLLVSELEKEISHLKEVKTLLIIILVTHFVFNAICVLSFLFYLLC